MEGRVFQWMGKFMIWPFIPGKPSVVVKGEDEFIRDFLAAPVLRYRLHDHLIVVGNPVLLVGRGIRMSRLLKGVYL